MRGTKDMTIGMNFEYDYRNHHRHGISLNPLPTELIVLIYQVMTKQCLKKYFSYLMTLTQMAIAFLKPVQKDGSLAGIN